MIGWKNNLPDGQLNSRAFGLLRYNVNVWTLQAYHIKKSFQTTVERVGKNRLTVLKPHDNHVRLVSIWLQQLRKSSMIVIIIWKQLFSSRVRLDVTMITKPGLTFETDIHQGAHFTISVVFSRALRESKHGNRKRTFLVVGKYCRPDVYTTRV